MRDKIRQYLKNDTRLSLSAELTDDTNLIERGIVESINAISLVIFLENEFGVQVNSGDLIGSNFQSINHIVAFIEKKKGLSHGQ